MGKSKSEDIHPGSATPLLNADTAGQCSDPYSFDKDKDTDPDPAF
jgi:hypothetical protein